MQVYANDLNPKSFQYLCENIELNKVMRMPAIAYGNRPAVLPFVVHS